MLELAQKAHQLFEVAEIDERRQLIKLVLSNLRLEGRKLRYEAIKPFKTILDFSDCQQWLEDRNVNITSQFVRIFKVFEDFRFIQQLREEMDKVRPVVVMAV